MNIRNNVFTLSVHQLADIADGFVSKMKLLDLAINLQFCTAPVTGSNGPIKLQCQFLLRKKQIIGSFQNFH